MNNSIPEITLNDGVTLPVIGLGTYDLRGAEGAKAVNSAIDLGYRPLTPLTVMKTKVA